MQLLTCIYLYYSARNSDPVPTNGYLGELAPTPVSPEVSTTALVYCDSHAVQLK
jgi:hypothetical protein